MKLLVRVIRAKNTPGLDPNGSRDPYVRLQLGKQRFRTKAVKKSSSPSWGEEFTFRVEDLEEELLVCVLEEDKYFNDDFVGQLRVRASHVFEADDKSLGTAWHALLPKSNKSKNKSCGEILLTICFSQNNTSVDRNPDDQTLPVDFDEMMKAMEAKDQGVEVPNRLPGGVVIDQLYGTSPRELNSILFSPDSDFGKSAADAQGSTDLQISPWKYEHDGVTLKRVVSYTKAASKLIKALKATEEQTYLKGDGMTFSVICKASTPDAPFGKTFKTEVLYRITAGPQQPSGDQSSRLEVSWRVNFSQSTMMRGLIEGGARQGLKESFDQYEKLLSQIVKPLVVEEVGLEKDQMLVSLRVEQQSDWKLAARYFANTRVVTTVCTALYVLVHVWMCMPSNVQGLEFVGLDLPDSIGEVIACGFLVMQGKRVLELMSRFMQARVQNGSDHGTKAQGDGWLLTVALIEGRDLEAVDSRGLSDPYVVFTCNGKTRTSSIKFQETDPLWNEILEFDAMQEPPSVLNVEVFAFDGPLDDATSLGCAEINFLRSNFSELSDIWIPLQGKFAQTCQSKLHLRIFLNNNRGGSVVKDYLTKMEKEVGKKIKLCSPKKNSEFQKLFTLPPEEFLVNYFACHLKRRMPHQGRLFLSARVIGFRADLFVDRTKFFFLWEDVEDIRVIPPTLSSMGSPIIIMTLRPGRGFDAQHGARTQDSEGRLKYRFHSFVSFNVAHRTIMALWKARASTPEQNVMPRAHWSGPDSEGSSKKLRFVDEEGWSDDQ